MSRSGDFRGDDRQTDRQTDYFTPAHARGVNIYYIYRSYPITGSGALAVPGDLVIPADSLTASLVLGLVVLLCLWVD